MSVQAPDSQYVTMLPTERTPLGRAVTVQMRVLADLAHRWFAQNNGTGRAACWSRRGTLVIIANGSHAERIAGELQRARLIDPQRDKPEHLHPKERA